MANKVLMGFSDLYVGTYEVNNGVVTLGTPYHQAGAVGFKPEPQGDENTFYADNIGYYTSYSGGKRQGDLEVAMFDDEFKTQFLGYRETADGGLAEVKNANKPSIYAMWKILGDAEDRKVIMYNGSLGEINREYSTLEDNKEVVTETVPATFVGDNGTGITIAQYKPGDAGYDTLFTTPPVPALKP